MSKDEGNSALFHQFLEWKKSMESTSASKFTPQEEVKEVPSPSFFSNSSTEEGTFKTSDSANPASGSQHSNFPQPAGTTPNQASSSDFTADQYLAKSGKDNHSPQATRK